jgi:hypothetical protein
MFNLSFESLTSREALHALRDVQKNDVKIWGVSRQLNTGLRFLKLIKKRSFPLHMLRMLSDPSDVAVDAVLQHIASGTTSRRVLNEMMQWNIKFQWLMTGSRTLSPRERVVASVDASQIPSITIFGSTRRFFRVFTMCHNLGSLTSILV